MADIIPCPLTTRYDAESDYQLSGRSLHVNLSVSSKLSIHAVKSTFSIEEDTIEIPCSTNDESTTTKVLSIRVPAEVSESFTLALKRSTVKKTESLKLCFDYSVRTPQGFVPCSVNGLQHSS